MVIIIYMKNSWDILIVFIKNKSLVDRSSIYRSVSTGLSRGDGEVRWSTEAVILLLPFLVPLILQWVKMRVLILKYLDFVSVQPPSYWRLLVDNDYKSIRRSGVWFYSIWIYCFLDPLILHYPWTKGLACRRHSDCDCPGGGTGSCGSAPERGCVCDSILRCLWNRR